MNGNQINPISSIYDFVMEKEEYIESASRAGMKDAFAIGRKARGYNDQ